jgi:hypothetical protein
LDPKSGKASSTIHSKGLLLLSLKLTSMDWSSLEVLAASPRLAAIGYF